MYRKVRMPAPEVIGNALRAVRALLKDALPARA